MISSLCFIPRGAAKAIPDQQELSTEEMEDLIQRQTGMSLTDANDAEAEVAAEGTAATGDDSDAEMEEDEEKKDDDVLDDKEAQLLKELSMDGYDEEPEGAELMLGGQKLVVHENNADDPYVTVPDHEDYDEEDDEDLEVKATDVLICVGKTEEEASTLETYLYEEESGKLYVHHDFNLPSFPLALCWMNTDPRTGAAAAAAPAAPSTDAARGSFLAVGTMQTGIEIWNLDVLDALEPVAVLGGRDDPDPKVVQAALEAEAAKNKKKGKKGAALTAAFQSKVFGELRPGSHADSVMALAWHPSAPTRLASGSADHTVKLWDICTQQCVNTFSTLHTNKVQALQWNFAEPNILLSGAYDQTACVTDIRANTAKREGVNTFRVNADIEQAKWSPHEAYIFAVSLESGEVVFFDARNQASRLFTVSAHSQACSSLSFNSVLPNCFLTASLDKTVKVWDFAGSQATLVSKKEMKALGSIFTANFDTNYAHLIAVGGDKGKLGIWDMREDSNCRFKYGEECDGQSARAPAAGVNPFAFPASASASAPPAAASASAPAPASSSADKKKKKMKTSTRRVRDDESD